MNVKYLPKSHIETAAFNLLVVYGQKFGELSKPPIPVDEIIESHLQLDYGFDDLSSVLSMPDVLGLRSNATSFGIPEDFFEHRDIHIHVPSGAVRKDGPSAGLAIAVALISLLLGKPARRDAAVSGEITLTGRVLPVGRIAEKVLAARRTGIKTVVVPAKNSVDLEQLDEEQRRDVTVHLVDDVREAALIVIPRGIPEG